LQGRTDAEVLWHQRRSFLRNAAAWTAMGGFAGAQAQTAGNIVELLGDALVNGARLLPQRTIQTGDRLETGPASNLIFVLGNASFHMRQNSRLTVERGNTLNAVSVLHLFSGAVASVWGRGNRRQIITPTLTAGIRGTGVYAEVVPSQNNRSYLCNCYGTLDIAAGTDRLVSQASYHQSFWGDAQPTAGRYVTPAAAINHTDEELEFLARLINQRTAWQLAGGKGSRDGKGYMPDAQGQMHPAEMLGK
jgi:hypothetical protein